MFSGNSLDSLDSAIPGLPGIDYPIFSRYSFLNIITFVVAVTVNQQCDVIKMREMKGEVEKKTHKKEMDKPSFL